MARTGVRLVITLSMSGPRPEPPRFKVWASIGETLIIELDDDTVIMVPDGYYEGRDNSSNVAWREDAEASRCWATTLVYEQLKESYPRLTPYVITPRSEHGTPLSTPRSVDWLPILYKPTGRPLEEFLEKNISNMYTTSVTVTRRVLPSHQPLVLQWALHLDSPLTFVHKHVIIYGEIESRNCWLSSSLLLSLAGFLSAEFRSHAHSGALYRSQSTSGFTFNPRSISKIPNTKTDILWWGCVVYELMTGLWPEYEQARSYEERKAMVTWREWPSLQAEFLGNIVKKCWEGEYATSENLKQDVMRFVETDG
ncbi:hypothetical protein PT974_06940 [Cladobotryum mycophilum]|uniref:Protein kinase domain-containing protein n=1 Tax=Cladobotryum mycophilum TaxID=491253 RepID=A0ABR0SMU7_9HYPO